MEFTTSVDIDAPPERVWAVLADVRRWPEWTASMSRVELLEGGPLAVGSTVRVKQPRLRAEVWRVTEFEPGRSFVWVARGGGVTTEAAHRVEPASGGTRVTLGLRQRGPLAPLVRLVGGALVRRYMGLEAAGLKRESEAG